MPFYDTRSGTALPCSVLPLLLVTLAFALITSSFGRYDFFNMLPLAAYPLYLTLLAGPAAWRALRGLLPLSVFIIFIGIWNIFFDKNVVTLLGVEIGAGWLSLASLILKFLLTGGAVLAMFSLTGFDSICRALATSGFPAILTGQLFLFYRYAALVTSETRNVIRARLFRGGRISVSQSGNICGPLILRCAARSRRIHSALDCRGRAEMIYKGKSTQTRFVFSDKIFGVVWISLFLAVRLGLASIIGDYIARYAAC